MNLIVLIRRRATAVVVVVKVCTAEVASVRLTVKQVDRSDARTTQRGKHFNGNI